MSMDGTGMTPPPQSSPAGAVNSTEVGRKKPHQGKLRSGLKVDTNRHGIRRETSLDPKPPRKVGRKKI
jgi:hypothetical protein